MKIEIYDQTYKFSADQDEEYLKKLAAYVDEKMRVVGESTRTVDSLKVAVLAALNIADEMFTLARAPAGNRRTAAKARGKVRRAGRKSSGTLELTDSTDASA